MSISNALCEMPTEQLQVELEEYRIAFEKIHGETDLTLRYTSTWPREQQIWLMQHDFKRYLSGLPAFVQAYLHGKMELAASRGELDNMPDNALALFLRRSFPDGLSRTRAA
jgi:hypothetical protein